MNDGPDHEAMARQAVLLLAAEDNVAVCRRNIAAGEVIEVGGEAIVARAELLLGHKVARRFIATGGTIVKYGMPIGSATADIECGDWVHLHNMQSNYLATHTRALKVKA